MKILHKDNENVFWHFGRTEQMRGVNFLDIKYLLFLQELRESAPEWINNLMQIITDTAGGILILFVPMIALFCIDKKKGEFIWI